MSDTTKTGKTETATSTSTGKEKKKSSTNKTPNLQLQRIVGGQSETIAVFRTQKEGIAWLTENQKEEMDATDKLNTKDDESVRYQFARLLGKPRALKVEVRVKLK